MHVALLPFAFVLLTAAEQGASVAIKLTSVRSAACIFSNSSLQDKTEQGSTYVKHGQLAVLLQSVPRRWV
jgi:hypothetical protein